MPSLPDPPDAFHCPYRHECFQREVFRWIATIVLALTTTWVTGCAFHWNGLGVVLDVKPPVPSTRPVVDDTTP